MPMQLSLFFHHADAANKACNTSHSSAIGLQLPVVASPP
jgi:hypothetical protein